MPTSPTDLNRAAEKRLAAIRSVMPVAVVTGPRQTGKSYLVTHATSLSDYQRVDLDDASTRAAATADPDSFVRTASRLIIDEVQRVPDVLLAVKAAVDDDEQRVKGRFILTGSANLLLMQRVADSLAGRAGYLALQPMTRGELNGQGTTGRWSTFFETPPQDWPTALETPGAARSDWRALARVGGFPVPATQLDAAGRQEWFRGYVATYLERDLRDISVVSDLADFRRAMAAFAIRAGTPINHADVARELNLVARTLNRWLDLLDVTYQVQRLPAYAIRRSARVRKRAKYYWNDPALAMYVAGIDEPGGVHLETMILNDLRAWANLDDRQPLLQYWRDEANREVDFIVERDTRVLAIEVKATRNPGPDDWRHLAHFVTEYHRECIGAVLLHDGDRTFRVADRIVATPWWRVI